ncbi:hypothetical protein [Bosea caraganae]|uniref:antitoxin PaaA2 family protein n=1 Tax=Bosea caraganae TaxID=2763117 RepID=UPI0015F1258D|nr:hypothetical protein [Bosea caraganae]
MGTQRPVLHAGRDRKLAPDAWWRTKLREAFDGNRPAIPHQRVMDEAQALIDEKRRKKT